MRLLPAGPRAVLADVGDLDAVLALDHLLRGLRTSGVPVWRSVVDVVPAAATVLVTVASAADLGPVREALLALPPTAPADRNGGPVVEIPVRYDGPDLEAVGEFTGLGADGVVAAHTGREWLAAFAGFAPGFSYLSGGDPALTVPRLAEPRTRVPAGSVGLAGNLSGIYPRASPGGWQLIGTTDVALWDATREPPALLAPGVRVRFVVA